MLTQKRYIISHIIDQPFFFSLFFFFLHSRLTREEVGLEASLWHRVVWLELDPHVVVDWGDDVRLLHAAELPVKRWVGTQPAAHLNVVVFTHLMEKNTRHIDVTVGHEICSFCTNSRHFLRSQTYRTPGWCGTGWAPPAATRSSCLVGTPWASLGWWGNRSARWWSHRRQLLVGESSDFSGTSVKDKTLATHKLHRKPWVNYLALYFFLCWLKKKSSETEVVEF